MIMLEINCQLGPFNTGIMIEKMFEKPRLDKALLRLLKTTRWVSHTSSDCLKNQADNITGYESPVEQAWFETGGSG